MPLSSLITGIPDRITGMNLRQGEKTFGLRREGGWNEGKGDAILITTEYRAVSFLVVQPVLSYILNNYFSMINGVAVENGDTYNDFKIPTFIKKKLQDLATGIRRHCQNKLGTCLDA